ncbi:MAG: class I SAM-dependent methyltransferase [Thermoplasmata archaeon]
MIDQRKEWEKFYRGKGGWNGYGIIPYFEEYVKKDDDVLDIGSGSGKYSFLYLYRGYRITMLDFSMNALRKTRLFHDRICADARFIPFRDNSFDAVIMFNVLENFNEYEIEKLTGEVNRIMKNNGLIFLNVISKGDFRYGKGVEIERDTFLKDNGIMTHYFDIEEIKNYFKNFKIEYIKILNKKLRYTDKQEERIFSIIKK